MDKKVIDRLYELYEPKESITFDSLLNMITEQMSNIQFLREDEASTSVFDQEEINISLPTIRITEDFGKVGTKDRAMIEKFARNIAGNTLEEKLANLNSVLTEKKEGATVGEILSTMVMAEMLYAILTSFTESAGGFIFEGFLAGLFGDKSVQITTPEDIPGMDAKGKPITDVVLNDKHYSLKLLGQTTGVKGSFNNMVEHFKAVPHVIYLDARRINKDQGLQFGEFTITLEGFLDIFVTPFLKTVWRQEADNFEDAASFQQKIYELKNSNVGVKRIAFGRKGFSEQNPNWAIFDFSPKAGMLQEGKIGPEAMSQLMDQIIGANPEELQNFANFAVIYAESKFEGTKAEKLFGSYGLVDEIREAINDKNRAEILRLLELTPGYKDPQQFEFTRDQAESIGNFREVGTLMIGERYMKATWASYADLLKETIGPVYRQLQVFTDNVNNYFLGVAEEEDQQGRSVYAQDAIDDAQKLQVVTTNAVDKLETTEQTKPSV
jgi:hypothetical protein